MIRFRLLLMVAVAVLSAPQLRADLSARVCNTGQLNVDVGLAYEDPGVIMADCVVSAWHRIPPGNCKQIDHNSIACENRYNFTPCAHVYVAYAFTDSTGVWGAADVKDKTWYPRGEKICVTQDAIGEHRPSNIAHHTLGLTGITDSPLGKGKMLRTGTPFTVTVSNTTLNAVASSQFADCISPPRVLGSIHQWYDKSTFAAPTAGRFGTCGANNLWGPGLINADLGLDRNFNLSARLCRHGALPIPCGRASSSARSG